MGLREAEKILLGLSYDTHLMSLGDNAYYYGINYIRKVKKIGRHARHKLLRYGIKRVRKRIYWLSRPRVIMLRLLS